METFLHQDSPLSKNRFKSSYEEWKLIAALSILYARHRFKSSYEEWKLKWQNVADAWGRRFKSSYEEWKQFHTTFTQHYIYRFKSSYEEWKQNEDQPQKAKDQQDSNLPMRNGNTERP